MCPLEAKYCAAKRICLVKRILCGYEKRSPASWRPFPWIELPQWLRINSFYILKVHVNEKWPSVSRRPLFWIEHPTDYVRLVSTFFRYMSMHRSHLFTTQKSGFRFSLATNRTAYGCLRSSTDRTPHWLWGGCEFESRRGHPTSTERVS